VQRAAEKPRQSKCPNSSQKKKKNSNKYHATKGSKTITQTTYKNKIKQNKKKAKKKTKERRKHTKKTHTNITTTTGNHYTHEILTNSSHDFVLFSFFMHRQAFSEGDCAQARCVPRTF
jgi:hypothetical protein